MQNFTYHNPVKILFGKGQIAALAGEIPAGAKVLLTYGGGSIKKNGVYEQVCAALADFAVVEFSGIEPNPRYETLMKAVVLGRQEKVDFILAVGGGSVIDGSKFIAAAIPFAGEPWDILAKKAAVTVAVPLGSVLTLPATGSEMNAFAVISREEIHEKLAFGSPLVMPRFSVLDPETSFSLPPRQVGNGVVDAFVHVLEQYLTHDENAPLQARQAEAVLKTLVEEGPKALAHPDDIAVRANIMWSATAALNGLISCGVPQDWATHNIGHEITALTGIDHARTLALVLPSLLRVKKAAKHARLLQFAERVWGIIEGDEAARIEAAIAHTAAFFESMGVPTRLAAYKLEVNLAEEVTRRLSARGAFPLGAERNVSAEDTKQILTLAA